MNFEENKKEIIEILILLLVGLLSFTLLAKIFTSPSLTSVFTTYLDQKRKTVLEISAASTAASAAITMIPGDVGTPIADKLADLSTYSLIVLCAILLEKYLVTITGLAVFRIIVPLICVLLIVHIGFHDKWNLKPLAKRLAGFALAIGLVIPISISTSMLIENTYQTSIQETIDSARENAQQIQENAQGAKTGSTSAWNKFLSTIEGGLSAVTESFENTLNVFIEALAVMIVTSFVIPILVLAFFVWIIKLVFRIDQKLPIQSRISQSSLL